MRIAIFSDIHSNYHALEAVLADIEQRGADRLICLGDITLKGPLPKECVDRVRGLGCPVVLGNADGAYSAEHHPSVYPARNQSQVAIQQDFDRHFAALDPSDRNWLTSLPLTHTEEVEGQVMDFFHAMPHDNYILVMPWARNEELAKMRLSVRTSVSAFGHNHRPFVRTHGGLTVVNAGSVGIPFDGDPRPSYLLIDAGPGTLSVQIRRIPYDAEKAIRTARQVGMAGWEFFAQTARTGQFPG